MTGGVESMLIKSWLRETMVLEALAMSMLTSNTVKRIGKDDNAK